jgi:hypothetical protein
MATEKFKPPELYGITRVDGQGFAGWKVDLDLHIVGMVKRRYAGDRCGIPWHVIAVAKAHEPDARDLRKRSPFAFTCSAGRG